MAHLNEIIVRTAKIADSTLEQVQASLAEAYSNFDVLEIRDLDAEWEAVLSRELTDKEFAKMAALPFEEEEEVEEEGAEESEESADEDGADEIGVEDVLEEDEEKEESSEPGKSDDEKKSTRSELKDIESLLLELKTQIESLQDKANVVDKVHDTIAPHLDGEGEGLGAEPMLPEPPVGGPEGLNGPQPAPKTPGKLGPTAPGGGNPLGLDESRKAAVKKSNIKIAYASMREGRVEFSIPEVIAAMEERFRGYKVEDIRSDVSNNRYVAKLIRR